MRRYILAPEAALDLVEIWRYLKNEANVEIAERVERAIREKIVFLARVPGAGHWRRDLTDESVRFLGTGMWNVFFPNASDGRVWGSPDVYPFMGPSLRRRARTRPVSRARWASVSAGSVGMKRG